MEATTDLWEMAPESATRVGHPAPFPVELPERLIHLHTYEGDLVLDPFMGSGTTAVAAVRTGRHYVGYDTDPAYVARAEARVAAEFHERLEGDASTERQFRTAIPAVRRAEAGETSAGDHLERAVRQGRQVKEVAAALLLDCGFTNLRQDVKHPCGVEVDLVATDARGDDWAFAVSGAFTSNRAGLRRTDALWKAIGQASALHFDPAFDLPLVLLTTDAPVKKSAGGRALRAATGSGKPVAAVLEILDPAGRTDLSRFAAEGRAARSEAPPVR